MLTPYIDKAYKNGVNQHLLIEGVERLTTVEAITQEETVATPVIIKTTAAIFNKTHI